MRKNKFKKIICLFAALLTALALPSGIFAAPGFAYTDTPVYFERDSASGWTDYVQNEYHYGDENGPIIYCVEGGNPFCWDDLTQITGWDGTVWALYYVNADTRLKAGISVEDYLRGLITIASWGYPYYIPEGMSLPEVRYATSAAMHVYTALCVNDPASAGFGKSYWGEYNPDTRMRPKAGVYRSDVVYDWFTELYWRGLTQYQLPQSVSLSASETELAVLGTDFTGQVTVHLENMLGGYVIDQTCLDEIEALGGSVTGFTGQDGDVLTFTIPRYGNRNRSISLSVTASDPRNTADFGIVVSDADPWSYQKCVGFMGVTGDMTKTASAVLRTGNYGLPVSIEKSSSEGWTEGNALYSLAGAQYRLSGTTVGGEAVSEVLTLDAQGQATGSLQFAVGTSVEAAEISAPEGFITGAAQSITVSEDAALNVISVTDDPLYASAGEILVKQDASGIGPQGNASLEGAAYLVRFYGGLYDSEAEAETAGTLLKSWILSTDSSGLMIMDDVHKVSGDAFYMHAGLAVLPLGTLVIKEQNAPAGYSLDDQAYVMRITEGAGGTALREGSGLDAQGRAVSSETVKRFGIRGVKLDAAKNAAEASGDAALSGGRIVVINRSASAVKVGGTIAAPGETAAEIVTAANGSFVLSAQLPYGRYELVESSAPMGYELSNWSYIFSVSPSDPDGTVFEVPADLALKDEALTQDLVIRKWDRQRGIGVTGAVSPREALEGIIFEVINRSLRSVVWAGRTIEPGETVSTVQTVFDGVSGEYRAVLSGLPYGTYGVRELASGGGTNANSWYLADSTAEVQLALHKTGAQRTTYLDVADTRVCSLTVTKTVSGNMGSKDKDFAFELTLGDNSGAAVGFVKTLADSSTESSTAVFSGGKFAFTLKHGERIVFENIVCGNSYRLSEPSAADEGYALSWTGQPEGTLAEDTSVSANNDRNAVVSTGLSHAEGREAAALFGGFAGAAILITTGIKERHGRRGRKKKPDGRA